MSTPTDINIQIFINLLSFIDWTDIYCINEIDDKFIHFFKYPYMGSEFGFPIKTSKHEWM